MQKQSFNNSQINSVHIDHENLKLENSITEQLKDGETVLFSCIVQKVNVGVLAVKDDLRIIMVTNMAVYNVKSNMFGVKYEIQRCISLDKIKWVTIGTQQGNDQFIINVIDEYDYLFRSKDMRPYILNALKHVYFNAKNQNLPVFGVPEKLTEKHMTTKKQI